MKPIAVTTPDGLTIAAGEWGNPTGPEIVFIHGFCQSALSWTRQLADPALAAEFRMVAYDLRGHGASDKPTATEHYTDDRRWADELAAVIAAAGMKRPVLVGWSYAGRVITDYVRTHGPGGIAGINFVAALAKTDAAQFGPGGRHLPGMLSDDLATNIEATRGFLRACFEKQPNADEFETMLAFNMVIPPRVREALRSRTANPGDLLPTLRLPVLVTHGVLDQLVLVGMARSVAATVPGAKLSVYDGIGHAPFFEDAARFNRELAAFVRAAAKKS